MRASPRSRSPARTRTRRWTATTSTTASIAAASSAATDAGVADRARFEVRDAADPTIEGDYDLVMAIEMLHDVPDPVGILRTMRTLAGSNGNGARGRRANRGLVHGADQRDGALLLLVQHAALPGGQHAGRRRGHRHGDPTRTRCAATRPKPASRRSRRSTSSTRSSCSTAWRSRGIQVDGSTSARRSATASNRGAYKSGNSSSSRRKSLRSITSIVMSVRAHDGRIPGPVEQQRHLTEEGARPTNRDDFTVASHLGFAVDDDEELAAGLTFPDQLAPLTDVERRHEPVDCGQLLRRELLEQRDRRQELLAASMLHASSFDRDRLHPNLTRDAEPLPQHRASSRAARSARSRAVPTERVEPRTSTPYVFVSQWAGKGSNLRPRDYESPALTTELPAPAGHSDRRPAQARGVPGWRRHTSERRRETVSSCRESTPSPCAESAASPGASSCRPGRHRTGNTRRSAAWRD